MSLPLDSVLPRVRPTLKSTAKPKQKHNKSRDVKSAKQAEKA